MRMRAFGVSGRGGSAGWPEACQQAACQEDWRQVETSVAKELARPSAQRAQCSGTTAWS